jgi:hypothetical protein
MLLNIVVLFLFATTVFLMISYVYNLSPFFRGLFEGTSGGAGAGAASGGTAVGGDPEMAIFYSKLSFYIFSSIIVIQWHYFFIQELCISCIIVIIKHHENQFQT